MSRKRNLLRGLSVSLSFISALLLSGEIIATSSTDYKSMIDGLFGVTNVVSGNSDAYMFKSDFNNTIDLYTKRSEIVKQIAAEGCVLLKNENKALPLRNGIDSTELQD